MGRKSAKATERKLKRKQEKEISDQLWSIVKKANEVENPLSPLVSFTKYTKNGLNLTIECVKRHELDDKTLKWAFELTKEHMEGIYVECGWGWRDKDKLNEMKEHNAIYLIARDESGNPAAFVHFRFDLDYALPVVYCYEIQLEKRVQRHGLGVFLMQILQLLAIKNSLFKVMATVIKVNEVSMNFFCEKLKFTEDETSPDDESYVIVCKHTKHNASTILSLT